MTEAKHKTADVWNIFYIQGRLADQKLLQFKITNNSGGSSDIENRIYEVGIMPKKKLTKAQVKAQDETDH